MAGPTTHGARLGFSRRYSILRVLVEGYSDSVDDVERYWLRIAEQVALSHPSAVLVVDRLDSPQIPLDDMQAILGRLCGRGLERIKVAYVVGPHDNFTDMEMLNLDALELGFALGIFQSEVQAMVWLQYGER